MANELITLENLSEFKSKFEGNLKTINGESIVGSGDIIIDGKTYTNGKNISIDTNNVISTSNDVKFQSLTIDPYGQAPNSPNIVFDGTGMRFMYPGATNPLMFINPMGELVYTTTNNSVVDMLDSKGLTINNKYPENVVDIKLIEGSNTYSIKDASNCYTKTESDGKYALTSDIPDISGLATKDEVEAKQDELVSGTNIKTINGESILGEGNITLSFTTATNAQIDALFGDDEEEE